MLKFIFVLLAAATTLESTIFEHCNIDDALNMQPISDIDHAYTYFIARRFKKDTRTALLYLLSSSKTTELPVLLLIARVATEGSPLKLSQEWLFMLFNQIGSEISKNYIQNRYRFYDIAVLGPLKERDIDDVLTTVWSLDSAVVDRFFSYVLRGKIGLASVRKELEMLSTRKKAKAFSLLGDIHYYGLGVPADTDRAMEYYMAGKQLKDGRSFLGIGKILREEPYGDTENAVEALDMAIKLERDAEAFYYRYLFEKARHAKQEATGDKKSQNDQEVYYLRSAALGGYLPAVYAYACMNAEFGLVESALYSFQNISQYAPFLLEIAEKAATAYKRGELKRALLYYLFLAEYKVEAGLKNAIYLLENHRVLRGTGDGGATDARLLFELYGEMALKHKKYYKNIGDCYYYGQGVERSLKDAFANYMSSMAYSDESLYNVAYMYENGEGVPRNLPLAYAYLSTSFKSRKCYLVAFYGKIRIILKRMLSWYLVATVCALSLGTIILMKRH